MGKILIGLPALVALLLYLIAPAQALQQITTTLQVPLSGTVLVSLNDGSFDSVSLSGQANVVITVPLSLSDIPPDPIHPVRIHVNLDQVLGLGSITGKEYIATGTNRINFTIFPPGLVNFGFDLRFLPTPILAVYPPDPVMPLDIGFNFTFNPDTGELSNVSIESISVPSISAPELD